MHPGTSVDRSHPQETAETQGEGPARKCDDVIPRVVVTGADASPGRGGQQASGTEAGEVRVKWKTEEGKKEEDAGSVQQNGENGCQDGEEEDEEEDDMEMTEEEKKEMYDAVVNGDIELLEDLLNKPNADINMIWYNENLLMAAIRAKQTEMAEFLLDNGVNPNFYTAFVDVRENSKRRRRLDWYKYSCRQMAYDQGMSDLVNLIDSLNGELPYWIKPLQRIPRLRKLPPEPEPDPEAEDAEVRSPSGLSNAAASDVSSESDAKDGESRRRGSRLTVGEDEEAAREERRSSCRSVASVQSGDSGCHSPRGANPESGRLSGQGDPDSLDSPGSDTQKEARIRSGADDGYGTLSFKSSQCHSPDGKPDSTRAHFPRSPPPPCKWTKGAMQRQMLHPPATTQSQAREARENSVLLRPKVRVTGSYSVESSRWHKADIAPARRVSFQGDNSICSASASRRRVPESKSAKARLTADAPAAGTGVEEGKKSSLKKNISFSNVPVTQPFEAWGEKGGNSVKRQDPRRGAVVSRSQGNAKPPPSPRALTRDLSQTWADKSAVLTARRQKRVESSSSAPLVRHSTPYNAPLPGYLRMTQSACHKARNPDGEGRGRAGAGTASGIHVTLGSSLGLRPSLGMRNRQTYLPAKHVRQ